ncbi:uncharacterized protein PITG_20809 [Phytophthora infestans T30-4]|uniref:Uncharacterized protein n=1 Tax=Phytophthora infestans (strain T30-4) TaxID=403677 RepID=D0P316_PHYIT|nr:uncharacterized protein PITG_20809 [Phytophthora infestans T30-4]EEY58785.1 conserved hypothetical protein [Phytophthora infestans T30-4]|eukprot:XP_002895306.1 conserved hypothetical protein [Phytophthora infestans T30-4]
MSSHRFYKEDLSFALQNGPLFCDLAGAHGKHTPTGCSTNSSGCRGPHASVRWMLSGEPLYEIPAKTITEPRQGASVKNPSKIMIEEPMYLIFNVAMSSKWGAQPPNPKNVCRGDGLDPVANAICDAFPMYLKLDYIRVYQDLSPGSLMSVGCDPSTHPTRRWILDHLDEYEDEENKLVEVRGKAFCRTDADCTVQTAHRRAHGPRSTFVRTGRCLNRRCECVSLLGARTANVVPVLEGRKALACHCAN